MTDLDAILDRLRGAGLAIRADGGDLVLTGNVAALSPALRRQIVNRKQELLVLLAGEAPAPPQDARPTPPTPRQPVCCWAGCGQAVGPWQPDPERPGLAVQRCIHHHTQRQADGTYWRPIGEER